MTYWKCFRFLATLVVCGKQLGNYKNKNKNKNNFISERKNEIWQYNSIDNYTPGNPHYGYYRYHIGYQLT